MFVQASKAEHLVSMLEIAWAPVLAAFSVPLPLPAPPRRCPNRRPALLQADLLWTQVLLEESQDEAVDLHCVRGLAIGASLLAVSGLESQRDAFIATLVQFTSLHSHTVREMRRKHIESIKAAISLARTSGNFLGR